MTDMMMDLKAPLEKAPDAGFLRETMGFAAKQLMELEVGVLTGAAWGEKSEKRLVQRNGYRERDPRRDGGAAYPKLRQAPARTPPDRAGGRPG